MLFKLFKYYRRIYNNGRIAVALGKASATASLRKIDEKNPMTWEFSAFSQNGEDGIIDLLTNKISRPNRYFIEIGANDGIDNNTAWLAIAKKFNGIMIDGDQHSAKLAKQVMRLYALGVETLCQFVTKENVGDLLGRSLFPSPDVFSIDIDGNDFYVAKALLEGGFRPKIFIAEYNAAFGPHQAITIKYDSRFSHRKAHSTELYFGASIEAWKRLFLAYNYKFVTVESSGTNAFFINPIEFPEDFVSSIEGISYLENISQRKKFHCKWEELFQMIGDMPYHEVSSDFN